MFRVSVPFHSLVQFSIRLMSVHYGGPTWPWTTWANPGGAKRAHEHKRVNSSVGGLNTVATLILFPGVTDRKHLR